MKSWVCILLVVGALGIALSARQSQFAVGVSTVALASPASEAPGAVPAAPQSSPSTTSQPDFKAVNIDFIPGEKTLFYDNFSDMAEDEPPPHWKVSDGKVELQKSGALRQMTSVCPSHVSLHSESFQFPKNFTVEIEAAFAGELGSMDWYAWPKGVDGGEAPTWAFSISTDNVRFVGPTGDTIASQRLNPPIVKNQPINVAFWIQEGRARAYLNGVRIGDTNQVTVPANMKPPDHFTVRERCDRPTDGAISIRSVRVAESAPDFSTVLASSGKYVSHGITFDTDSDRLKPESAPVLKAVSRALDKNPNLKLEIDGYTDSVGDAQHNLDLSKRRADAVRTVLISQFGVESARLTSNGFGADKPVGSNDTAVGRAQNRRVEFLKK